MEANDQSQLLFEEKGRKNHPIMGLGLMAGAGMFLTVGDGILQYIFKEWPNRVTVSEVVLIRSLILLLFTAIFMIHGKVHPYDGSFKNFFMLNLMGAAEVGAVVFVYLALEKMPVGDATVIQHTAPVFTLAFSFTCLKEGCPIFDVICGFISFIGVAIMTRPSLIFGTYGHHFQKADAVTSKPGEPAYLIGVGFALIGTIMVSLLFILIRIAGKTFDVTVTILYPSILGAVISPIIKVSFDEVWFEKWNAKIWVYVAIVGLFSFVGLMLMAESLQIEDCVPAALVRNLDVVYAFLLETALVKVRPDLMTLAGASIVIFATSLIPLNRIYFSKLEICHKHQYKE